MLWLAVIAAWQAQAAPILPFSQKEQSMGRVEHQLEFVRGQIDELTGRLQSTATQLKDLSDFSQWLSAQISGRALEVRGKGRQALATTRMRAEELGEGLQGTRVFPLVGIVVAAAGLIAAVSLFWPEISAQLRSRFGWLFGEVQESMEMARRQAAEMAGRVVETTTGRR
ncbi:MAG: hypothetical protein HYY04_07240 [Chloroflexi bacterium]|nr:hypothetical protein [Chloroflexota bacterium]